MHRKEFFNYPRLINFFTLKLHSQNPNSFLIFNKFVYDFSPWKDFNHLSLLLKYKKKIWIVRTADFFLTNLYISKLLGFKNAIQKIIYDKGKPLYTAYSYIILYNTCYILWKYQPRIIFFKFSKKFLVLTLILFWFFIFLDVFQCILFA